jgi:PKHD-type hydroxylase
MLITIDQVLNTDELALARQLLAQSSWESGAVSAGAQAAQAKNNQQLPEQAAHLPSLRRLILDALNRTPLFFTAALPLKILPPFFNRYSGSSNTYGMHTDSAMRLIPGSAGQYLRADISATLFLSEPEEYEGGVLTIQDTFGTHGIKLNAGSLVLYPSSSVHAVSPVTQGTRLASFMFMQSMVRDEGQRRLLYEMDMALLKLRAEIGETDAVVQLTGTYHNLLRRWAESA